MLYTGVGTCQPEMGRITDWSGSERIGAVCGAEWSRKISRSLRSVMDRSKVFWSDGSMSLEPLRDPLRKIQLNMRYKSETCCCGTQKGSWPQLARPSKDKNKKVSNLCAQFFPLVPRFVTLVHAKKRGNKHVLKGGTGKNALPHDDPGSVVPERTCILVSTSSTAITWSPASLCRTGLQN